GDGRDSCGDHRRGRPLVPRPRRPAAADVLGRDAGDSTGSAGGCAAAGHLPRDCARAGRARVQRPGRRAARHPRPAHAPLMPAPLLEVTDLSVRFDTDDGQVHAVDRLSFTLEEGEVLGIVGESGCGKSVTCMSLVRLLPETAYVSGSVLFGGA